MTLKKVNLFLITMIRMIEKINMMTATEKVEEDMMMMAAEELEE